jgi:hypothetical protein
VLHGISPCVCQEVRGNELSLSERKDRPPQDSIPILRTVLRMARWFDWIIPWSYADSTLPLRISHALGAAANADQRQSLCKMSRVRQEQSASCFFFAFWANKTLSWARNFRRDEQIVRAGVS